METVAYNLPILASNNSTIPTLLSMIKRLFFHHAQQGERNLIFYPSKQNGWPAVEYWPWDLD